MAGLGASAQEYELETTHNTTIDAVFSRFLDKL